MLLMSMSSTAPMPLMMLAPITTPKSEESFDCGFTVGPPSVSLLIILSNSLSVFIVFFAVDYL